MFFGALTFFAMKNTSGAMNYQAGLSQAKKARSTLKNSQINSKKKSNTKFFCCCKSNDILSELNKQK